MPQNCGCWELTWSLKYRDATSTILHARLVGASRGLPKIAATSRDTTSSIFSRPQTPFPLISTTQQQHSLCLTLLTNSTKTNTVNQRHIYTLPSVHSCSRSSHQGRVIATPRINWILNTVHKPTILQATFVVLCPHTTYDISHQQWHTFDPIIVLIFPTAIIQTTTSF